MKLAFKLAMLAATSMAIMFLFQGYVLTQLGPGIESDAFFASTTIPQLVLAVVSNSLVQVLVPLLAGENNEQNRNDSWALMFLIGGFFAVISIVLTVLAAYWVPLSVPGFDNDGKILTIELTRIQLIGMIFTAINAVQLAAYYARDRFLWVELSSCIASIVAFIILVITLKNYGVIAAAWVSILKIIIQTFLLAPGMGRPIFKNSKSKTVLLAWSRIRPLLIGNIYYKTELLIDRFMLSLAVSGSLSIYYFAQQGYGAIVHILNRSIAGPSLPRLSVHFKNHDYQKFKRHYYLKLIQISLLCFVVITLLVFTGNYLDIFQGYGNFTKEDISYLWWVLILLSGMLLGGATGQIASTAFYASGNTVTPTRMSMLSYTIYIPIKLLAFMAWGISGLAIATSVYYLSNLLILMFLFDERWKCEYTK